jgi:hypothetical protein
VALAGAVLNFRVTGGTFKDLTDLDRMKRAFGGPGDGRSSSPPPPPPPPTAGPSPTPPPPPPAP